ncbi:hypothetical protein EJ07DRAFT_159666 [Lizonia empirigonia]|nr:hypothetical protein EJ07DRAFT_159666 [Lizonia empirigonia]
MAAQRVHIWRWCQICGAFSPMGDPPGGYLGLSTTSSAFAKVVQERKISWQRYVDVDSPGRVISRTGHTATAAARYKRLVPSRAGKTISTTYPKAASSSLAGDTPSFSLREMFSPAGTIMTGLARGTFNPKAVSSSLTSGEAKFLMPFYNSTNGDTLAWYLFLVFAQVSAERHQYARHHIWCLFTYKKLPTLQAQSFYSHETGKQIQNVVGPIFMRGLFFLCTLYMCRHLQRAIFESARERHGQACT